MTPKLGDFPYNSYFDIQSKYGSLASEPMVNKPNHGPTGSEAGPGDHARLRKRCAPYRIVKDNPDLYKIVSPLRLTFHFDQRYSLPRLCGQSFGSFSLVEPISRRSGQEIVRREPRCSFMTTIREPGPFILCRTGRRLATRQLSSA